MNKEANMKDVVCCVVDYGSHVSFAECLSKSFGKVYYYNPQQKKSFVQTKDLMVGKGLEEDGVFHLENMWDAFDEIDLYVFTDIGDGDLQLHLESMGKLVWGSRKGEELEIYRKEFKEHLKEIELPVNNYEVVTGMKALREYLKKNEDVYVKSTLTRGDCETFHSPKYSLVESVLDNLEVTLGARKNIVEFIVEQPISGDDIVEGGLDTYCIDGKYPSLVFCGYEVKDCSFFGKVKPYKEVSPLLTVVNDKIANTLKDYGYRGDISTEVRVGKAKKSFFTDATCRKPEPPTSLLENLYSNWGEIVLNGAQGICIDPKPVAKYGMQAIIYSNWSDEHWSEIIIDPKIKQFVKIKNLCKVDGKYYHVPQHIDMPQIGAVVSTGNTIKECIDKIKEYADGIEGTDIKINLSDLDKAVEVAKKGEKLGIYL